jgi:hypothetical protein
MPNAANTGMAMGDSYQWIILISLGSLIISVVSVLGRVLDKNLSIREYEAYRSAVARDIMRLENRLLDIERSRPTTGELQIVSESLGKRIDHLAK